MQRRKAVCVILLLVLSSFGLAQKNEFSLSVGAIATSDEQRNLIGITCPVNFPNCAGPINITTSNTVAFEGDYARQIFNFRVVSIAAEFPIVGVPSRDVSASQSGFPPVTASLASLFFTPSARIKFLPSGKISPFSASVEDWPTMTLACPGTEEHYSLAAVWISRPGSRTWAYEQKCGISGPEAQLRARFFSSNRPATKATSSPAPELYSSSKNRAGCSLARRCNPEIHSQLTFRPSGQRLSRPVPARRRCRLSATASFHRSRQ